MHESVSIFVEFLKSNLFLSSVFCIQTRIISPIVYYALKACFVILTTRFWQNTFTHIAWIFFRNVLKASSYIIVCWHRWKISAELQNLIMKIGNISTQWFKYCLTKIIQRPIPMISLHIIWIPKTRNCTSFDIKEFGI